MIPLLKKNSKINSEKIDQLRLIRTDGVGPITFFKLMNRYKSASDSIKALLTFRTNKKFLIPSKEKVEKEFLAHKKTNAELISFYDDIYPKALRHIADPPPFLSVRGNLNLLNQSTYLGVVGSRNASLNAQKWCFKTCQDIGRTGIILISGLARGIDTICHKASIETGTIAVLGSGLNKIYPKENTSLYYEIAEKGLLVSEYPLDTPPHAQHFPRRNRIISGLSNGIVVVEAAKKSGSLISARYAIEQNKLIFAVPGSPFDPRCHGSNDLLKQGAFLVEEANDILDQFENMPFLQTNSDLFNKPQNIRNRQSDNEVIISNNIPFTKSNLRKKIETLLSVEPTLIDDIIRNCNQSVSRVSEVLLELEIEGQIEYHPGNKVSLIDFS